MFLKLILDCHFLIAKLGADRSSASPRWLHLPPTWFMLMLPFLAVTHLLAAGLAIAPTMQGA